MVVGARESTMPDMVARTLKVEWDRGEEVGHPSVCFLCVKSGLAIVYSFKWISVIVYSFK